MAVKEVACKKCGFVIEDPETKECPVCHNRRFTTFWKGSVYVADPENSDVAKRLGITQKGKYALRIN